MNRDKDSARKFKTLKKQGLVSHYRTHSRPKARQSKTLKKGTTRDGRR